MEDEFSLVQDFAVLMVAAGIGLLVFRRIHQTGVLGYLLAGLLVGPFFLPFQLINNIDIVRTLADLGLIVILFTLGLDMEWSRIRQVGLQSLLIGSTEMAVTMALGYEMGILFGLSSKEALFLGGALSISSSAVITKILRESGQLRDIRGRIIVGVLVVENFAAVVILTVLSGVSTTGSADAAGISGLAFRLAIFTITALILGALFTPRLMRFLAGFQSQEVLIVTGLALCFGLAVVGHSLGLSAAAGAFLIGAIIGDSEQSSRLGEAMTPVRHMFAAIFFVSVGTLVNPAHVLEFLIPAIIITIVFTLAKVIATTVGAFLTGYSGRRSLDIGTGMPQVGEFSLAMAKVGTENGAVGPFLYPVIATTAATTAIAYPFIIRANVAIADFLERRSPFLLRRYVRIMTVWIEALRSAIGAGSHIDLRIRYLNRLLFINIGIILLTIAVGTGLARISGRLAHNLGIGETLLSVLIAGGVVFISLPSALYTIRTLRSLADEVTTVAMSWFPVALEGWSERTLRIAVRDTLVLVVTALILVWSLPFLSHILGLGTGGMIVAIVLILFVVALTGKTTRTIHSQLTDAFLWTFWRSPTTGGEAQQTQPPSTDQETSEKPKG